MPIQSGKYVTPAWQNGGSPAITAEELTAIGQSIEQNQDDIEQNATDIQTANNNIQTANNNIQQNAQDIDSLQTWQSKVNGQISSIQSGYLQKTGGTMTGVLNMGNKRITNLATPSSGTDAANKNYVDGKANYRLLSTATATMSNLDFSLTVNPSTVLPNQLFICFNVTNLVGNEAAMIRVRVSANRYLIINLNGNNNIYRTYPAAYPNTGSTGGNFYVEDFTYSDMYSFSVNGNEISGSFIFYGGNSPTSATIKVSIYELY